MFELHWCAQSQLPQSETCSQLSVERHYNFLSKTGRALGQMTAQQLCWRGLLGSVTACSSGGSDTWDCCSLTSTCCWFVSVAPPQRSEEIKSLVCGIAALLCWMKSCIIKYAFRVLSWVSMEPVYVQHACQHVLPSGLLTICFCWDEKTTIQAHALALG